MITLFGPPEPTLLERLKDSVSKTKTELSAKVEQILTGDRPVDPELLRQLESALLSADIGVRTTKEVLAALRQQVNEHKLVEAKDLKRELKNQIAKILTFPPPAADGNGNSASPRVLFVVGVNGTGKTTTIGKLSNRLKKGGASVMLVRRRHIPRRRNRTARSLGPPLRRRSDQPKSRRRPIRRNFRRPLRRHRSQNRCRHRRHRWPPPHQIQSHGRARKNPAHPAKSVPGAHPDVLLVLDATTGQNGLNQAREFSSHCGVTGISSPSSTDRQRRHRLRHRPRTESPHPLRRHRRTNRRPGPLRPPNLCQFPLRLARFATARRQSRGVVFVARGFNRGKDIQETGALAPEVFFRFSSGHGFSRAEKDQSSGVSTPEVDL